MKCQVWCMIRRSVNFGGNFKKENQEINTLQNIIWSILYRENPSIISLDRIINCMLFVLKISISICKHEWCVDDRYHCSSTWWVRRKSEARVWKFPPKVRNKCNKFIEYIKFRFGANNIPDSQLTNSTNASEPQESADSQLTQGIEQQIPRNAKYLEAMRRMREEDRTTICVDFHDVLEFDVELAEAIELHYYR